MTTRLALIGLIAISLAACAVGPARSGIDLAQWRTLGPAAWRFDDGVAAAGPGDGRSYLVAPTRYDDFTLELEFEVDAGTNSGVFFRCAGTAATADDINPDTCYEANIWDEHPNQAFRTGAIVNHTLPQAKVSTIGRRSTMRIEADGPRVAVYVDDTLTAFLDDAETRAGAIALQYGGGGVVRFHRLSLRPQ
ncbi:MAG: DUF1080 domain-containing protein [Pseudomonadota bacterium]